MIEGENLEIKKYYKEEERMNLDKHSTQKMNKKGDRGSPCLKPLKGEKKPVLCPLS